MLFRQESNFLYLTGFDHPGARLLVGLDPQQSSLRAGEAWLFLPHGNPVLPGKPALINRVKVRGRVCISSNSVVLPLYSGADRV